MHEQTADQNRDERSEQDWTTSGGRFRRERIEQDRKQDRQQEESCQHRQSGLETIALPLPLRLHDHRELASAIPISKLTCVPPNEPKSSAAIAPSPRKTPNGKQHLHVSLALPRHQHDADDRTGQHTDKDRQNRESPTEISADHEHHLHVAEAHRFDAAQFFPRPTHQPQRTAADQRADECAGQRRPPTSAYRRARLADSEGRSSKCGVPVR